MQFKVTQQYQKGLEQLSKTFTKAADAKAYMEEQAAYNASLKIQVIYRLYDFDDIIAEMNSATYTPPSRPAAEPDSRGSQGQGSEASFRPTPLATSPRPAGMPQNWVVKKDDGKDNGKEDK